MIKHLFTRLHWTTGHILLTSPIFWVSNALVIGKCMVGGFTVLIPDKTDGENILRIIQDYKVS